MAQIYSDNGGLRGCRTRLFRDCQNGLGVEWMYAVDWAAGHDRWFGFFVAQGNSVAKMLKDGWPLEQWGSK